MTSKSKFTSPGIAVRTLRSKSKVCIELYGNISISCSIKPCSLSFASVVLVLARKDASYKTIDSSLLFLKAKCTTYSVYTKYSIPVQTNIVGIIIITVWHNLDNTSFGVFGIFMLFSIRACSLGYSFSGTSCHCLETLACSVVAA